MRKACGGRAFSTARTQELHVLWELGGLMTVAAGLLSDIVRCLTHYVRHNHSGFGFIVRGRRASLGGVLVRVDVVRSDATASLARLTFGLR